MPPGKAARLRTPKVGAKASDAWYRYYAGYSAAFVEDCIDDASLWPAALVVDPWNGSGTTTFIAAKRGLNSAGFDANPALLVVARARLLGLEVAPSIRPLLDEIIVRAGTDGYMGDATDPLSGWLAPSSVAYVRSLERALHHLLVASGEERRLSDPAALAGLSSLAAFFYVALFATVRDAVSGFSTTNPTWLKAPLTLANRARPSSQTLREAFKRNVLSLASRLSSGHSARTTPITGGDILVPELRTAYSDQIPLSGSTADAIITSPPYCTRIDYVVATRPELAVMGFDNDTIRCLRDSMLGTPTIIRKTALPDQPLASATATQFLQDVRAHRSHASKVYYSKYYVQYFEGLSAATAEISRLLAPDAPAYIVVQDSFYKEIRLDLARVIAEMGSFHSLAHSDTINFRVATTKAAVNSRSRQYRDFFGATESVVILRKKAGGHR